MKFIYYGFGGFIGCVCGIAINLIFYMVEKSGNRFISDFANENGAFGRYVAEMVNFFPVFGFVLGLMLVKILFDKELNKKDP